MRRKCSYATRPWIRPRHHLGRIALSVLLLGALISVRAQEPTLEDILASRGFTNIALTSEETLPAGSYEIHLLAEFADLHAVNTVSFYEKGTNDFRILIEGPAGNFGLTDPQISILLVAEKEFGLSFLTGPNRFFTETSGNPDSLQHAKIFKDLNEPGTFLIGFEDQLGGGDRDFQDMVFRLNPSEGPRYKLSSLPPLAVIPRVYIYEKDTPGLSNSDRRLVLSVVLDNPGNENKTLVLCPMLHVHDPAELKLDGQVLSITPSGGQRHATEIDAGFGGPGVYRHGRTMRFEFPRPTPFTIRSTT